MKGSSARAVAVGGVTAALAVALQCLGGLIPVATYVIPMLCGTLLCLIFHLCGSRIAWAWYGAVAVLGLLMGPDKEAGLLFLFLGYYPILKPKMDKLRFSGLWKWILFQVAISLMYAVLAYFLGVEQLMEENQELGILFLGIMLLLGNLTFYLWDKVLTRVAGKL